MKDVSIAAPVAPTGDLRFSTGSASTAPVTALAPAKEEAKLPSIYGKLPPVPTLDAVDGIKFARGA